MKSATAPLVLGALTSAALVAPILIADYVARQRLGADLRALIDEPGLLVESQRLLLTDLSEIFLVILGLAGAIGLLLAAFFTSLLAARDRSMRAAQQASLTDPLTGLFNRRFLDEQVRLRHAEAERFSRPYALLALDLDGLKQLNDKGGHACGDHALRAVAAALRSTLRTSDIAARTGGDEFLALLPGSSCSDAVRAGERVLAALARTAPDPLGRHATVSVGAAMWDRGRSATDVIRAADQALYVAKSAGKRRIVAEDAIAA